jgi:hypothetical protein
MASLSHMEYLISENISDSIEELIQMPLFVMEIVNLNIYIDSSDRHMKLSEEGSVLADHDSEVLRKQNF